MRADEGMNLLGMPHSPMTTGAMNLRAHQPSMSAALTEERVRNLFFANFAMLNHLRMFVSALLHPPTMHSWRERVLFIGTQFSNLYTAVDTPARGRVGSL
jgi:hypothetical protein